MVNDRKFQTLIACHNGVDKQRTDPDQTASLAAVYSLIMGFPVCYSAKQFVSSSPDNNDTCNQRHVYLRADGEKGAKVLSQKTLTSFSVTWTVNYVIWNILIHDNEPNIGSAYAKTIISLIASLKRIRKLGWLLTQYGNSVRHNSMEP